VAIWIRSSRRPRNGITQQLIARLKRILRKGAVAGQVDDLTKGLGDRGAGEILYQLRGIRPTASPNTPPVAQRPADQTSAVGRCVSSLAGGNTTPVAKRAGNGGNTGRPATQICRWKENKRPRRQIC
jgi:hypothetical protein